MCREWGVQSGEDVVGGVGQTRCGCEVVVVEVDGDVLEGLEAGGRQSRVRWLVG